MLPPAWILGLEQVKYARLKHIGLRVILKRTVAMPSPTWHVLRTIAPRAASILSYGAASAPEHHAQCGNRLRQQCRKVGKCAFEQTLTITETCAQ